MVNELYSRKQSTSMALDVNWSCPRIAPARRARAGNTLFTDFILHPAARITPLHRTSEFRYTCFSGSCGAFPCVCMLPCFYRTRKAQRVRDLCLVFWAPSWAALIHTKSYREIVAHTFLKVQKYDGLENIENPPRALKVTLAGFKHRLKFRP
jgi:hypothetical protein